MILLIDNYDSFTYNLYQVLSQFSLKIEVVRNDKISLPAIRELNPEAIVLSPGPGHPREAGICIPLIQMFSGKIPILGVCLGHQAIVQAFGGNIISASELVHGKATPIFHEHRGLFQKLPKPFLGGRYHSLIAEKGSLPAVLRIDATAEPDLIMAVKHLAHPTFGIQFHPESILTPEGNLLVQSFLEQSGVIPC